MENEISPLTNLIHAVMLIATVVVLLVAMQSCYNKEYNKACYEQTKDARCWGVK